MTDNYDRTSVATLSCEDAKAFVCDAVWGFAELDESGKFIWLNEAYAGILNAPVSLVLGTNFRDWTYDDDLDEDTALAERVRRGEIESYNLAKRYIQRGSTPKAPRIVWGMLTVVGKWNKAGSFLGYRVQFQPYDNKVAGTENHLWREIADWTLQNWKTILTIVVGTMSLIYGGSATLSSVSTEVERALESAEQQSSSSQSGQ